MLCDDFSDFIDMLKNLSEEAKKTVSVRIEDENVAVIMPIDGQETVIFFAEMKNFLWGFFILLGINIDDNLEEAS